MNGDGGGSGGVNKCMAPGHSAQVVSHGSGTLNCAKKKKKKTSTKCRGNVECDFQVLGALKAKGLLSFLF